MNTITFSPQVNTYNNIQPKRQINTPSFTGGKKITAQQAKKTGNFVQRLYSILFTPCGENLKGIKDGQVFTEKFTNEGSIRISKRYNMWSKKPNAVIKENGITALREKTVFNKDGSTDLEVHDFYTLDYPIKVGYKNIDKENLGNESLSLTYGDKKISIPNDKKDELYQEFNNILKEKFPQSISELKNFTPEEIDKLMEDFYKTPENVACSILSGPETLKEQLETVPRSLPYGIECIMDKLGQL